MYVTDVVQMMDVLLQSQADGLQRIDGFDGMLTTPAADGGDVAAVDLDVDAQLTVVHGRQFQFDRLDICANITRHIQHIDLFPITTSNTDWWLEKITQILNNFDFEKYNIDLFGH